MDYVNDTNVHSEIDKIENYCWLDCRKDCKFTYYIKDYIKFGHPSISLLGADITIKHNSLPDILIVYLFETTLNAFICNFGGLLGLWLGLSVFTIFSEFRDICIKLIRNRNNNWTTMNNRNIVH